MEAQRCTILFQGLSVGRHEFRFEVGKALFDEFQSAEINDGKCEVRVTLDRTETRMSLEIRISGYVVVACDRCLEDCSVPIEFEGVLPVRFSDEPHDWDGEVLWLLPGENVIDLTQYVYESIVLSLPYQRVHPDGECDPDMLRRFRIVSSDEFDAMEGEAAEASSGAVRKGDGWDKLAALRDRMASEGAEGAEEAEVAEKGASEKAGK